MNYAEQNSNRNFLSFRKFWEQHDLYNQKLKEYCERKEKESECAVVHVRQDNQVFILQVASWNHLYTVGETVYVQISGNQYDEKLGVILSVDETKCEMQVECDNYDFIHRYLHEKAKICKMKIVDAGSRVRIKRQREALRKLYQQETVNPHIRDILMGEYDWTPRQITTVPEELLPYLDVFGDNQGQIDSFVGAVEVPDIYLIQGPPGTGKTTVITELVKYANQHGKTVLVSSETHIAVDNVLERVKDMEQVLPIRLGNEENMSGDALLYVPRRRMEVIQKQVEEKQKEYWELEENFDWDGFVQKTEARWQEKIAQVEADIARHKARLPMGAEAEVLIKRFEAFPVLLRETLAVEKEYFTAEKEDMQVRARYQQLARQADALEAKVSAGNSVLFQTGIAAIDERDRGSRARQEQELSGLKEQMQREAMKLSQINFPRVRRIYERQRRKLDKEKAELEKYREQHKSFGEWMHDVNQEIFIIRTLEQKRAHWNQQKEQEIQHMKEDMLHKKELLARSREIRRQWLENLRSEATRQEMENIYIKRANVVFATCSGIASNTNRFFAEKQYDYCIIDEAAKCNTLDIIIPMTMGKKIIMVGDHKQLYPMLETDKVEDDFNKEQMAELKEKVLFKWLYEERIPDGYKTMLNIQYRMEKQIAQFVSETFYEGKLKSANAAETNSIPAAGNMQPSMVWMDSTGTLEQQADDRRGYYNKQEANMAVELLEQLNRECTQVTSVGVITTYRKQAKLLEQMCRQKEWEYLNVECSTVDAFQGKEKQIIIFNLVRSENLTSFVRDENRLNVAISRAKQRLVIIGNVSLVKRKGSGVLNNLYEYVRVHGKVEKR